MKKLAAVNGKAMAITEVGLKLGLRIHPINLGNKSNGTTSYLVDKKSNTHGDGGLGSKYDNITPPVGAEE